MNLAEAFRKVHAGASLSREEARGVFNDLLTEAPDPALLAGFLVALSKRGETADEVLGAAEALRAAARPFRHHCPQAIDTCGTGGDGLGTFNLSTGAAVLAAAAGAKVIKHGNRSVSSRSGSADFLEALGVRIDLSPQASLECLDTLGITYLHAPLYHPSLALAAPVRRALGVPTIFNLLGPLANPGRVKRQLLGVAEPARLEDYAKVLTGLGHERAYVVHGGGGADELSLQGGNRALPVGDAPALELDPTRIGLKSAPVAALAGGDPAANAATLRRLFEGEGGPLRDALIYNTAAALVVAGNVPSALAGLRAALEAIFSGAASALLDRWVVLSQRLSQA